MDMEISIFLAKFWGGLFMILGLMSIGANFLGRVIKISEDKTITVSTGYITLLLGLATVVSHSIWVMDWRIVITLLGWTTLFKGITKSIFPEHVSKKAQMFKRFKSLWTVVILLFGAWLLSKGLQIQL
jgi:hypothetical protein